MDTDLNASGPYQQRQPHFSNSPAGAINPALLASFPQPPPSSSNKHSKYNHQNVPIPAQLMGSMNMPSGNLPQQQQHHMTISPSQVLQQQQQQHHHHQQQMQQFMNGMGGINPAALTSPSIPQHQPAAVVSQQQPPSPSQLSSSSLLSSNSSSMPTSFFGVPSAQFNPFSSQDKQAKMMLAQQQHHHHQQQQQQANFREKQLHQSQIHGVDLNQSNQQSMFSGINIATQQHSPYNIQQQQQPRSFRDRALAHQQPQFRDQFNQSYPSQQQIMNVGGLSNSTLSGNMFPNMTQNQPKHQQNQDQDLIQGFAPSSSTGTSSSTFYDRSFGSGSSSSSLPIQHQHHQQQQQPIPPTTNMSRSALPSIRDSGFNSRSVFQHGSSGMLRPPSADMIGQDVANGFTSMHKGESSTRSQNPYPHSQAAVFGSPESHHSRGGSTLLGPGSGPASQVQLPPQMTGQFQQQQPRSTPTPLSSISPPPGSPYRGAKRKISESPIMGVVSSGLPSLGGSMGPPSFHRSLSASSSSDMINGVGVGGFPDYGGPGPQIMGSAMAPPTIHRPGSGMGINANGASVMGVNNPVSVQTTGATDPTLRPMMTQQQQQLLHQHKHLRHGSATASAPPLPVEAVVSSRAHVVSPAGHGAPAFMSNTAAPLSASAGVSMQHPGTTPQSQISLSQVVSMPPRVMSQIPAAPQPAPSKSPSPSMNITHTYAAASSGKVAGASNTQPVASGGGLGASQGQITGLNPAVTCVTTVPQADATKHIPPLSTEEVVEVRKWMAIDRAYQASWSAMRKRADEELREAMTLPWWEKGGSGSDGNRNRWRKQGEGFGIRWERPRKEANMAAVAGASNTSRRKVRREGLRLPRRLRPEETNRQEQLVPIRLEFDVEHYKMRDTFVWNLNDPVVTPENFAQTLVEDYSLGPSYHNVIVKAIQEQLSDYRAHMGFSDFDGTIGESEMSLVGGPSSSVAAVLEEQDGRENNSIDGGEEGAPKNGILEGVEEEWWARWREWMARGRERKGTSRFNNAKGKAKKRRKVAKEDGGIEGDIEDLAEGDADGDEASFWRKLRPLRVDQIKLNEGTMCEDMRIVIKLDIIFGSMNLEDQFEWDLDNENSSPEDFAEVYAQELGLGGEFKTAIAHCIREQVQAYQKTLFLMGHPSDASAIMDEDFRSSFLPSVTLATRVSDQIQAFTPVLSYLSEGELERGEKDRDKDLNKRRKRNTRGRRGVTLPDREPLRTHRTPAIGFPELDSAALAMAVATNAPVSRRAAAAAASLTIASMVASENGTSFVPQMPSMAMSSASSSMSSGTVAAIKDKKNGNNKGHFKTPDLPATVRHARAQLTGPTPSTAADVSTLPEPLENDPPPEMPAPPVVVAAPPAHPTAQEVRATKQMTQKRARELEREAKEREFADGQHANMINGIWHCSNCGCPENIAIGRRKGPLGDKSQCGACGKFWHRHRRPRPVDYNPDPDYHSGIKRDAETAKTAASAKKKGSRSQGSSTVPPTPKEMSEPPRTPRPLRGGGCGDADVSSSRRHSPVPTLALGGLDDDRPMSPVSSASSADELLLSQTVRSNGRASSPGGVPNGTSTPGKYANADGSSETSTSSLVKTNQAKPDLAASSATKPPLWLANAKESMMEKYPDDNFILRKANTGGAGDWRIKCLDCPGKLYTPGPAETLANYEVHLKNRQHRQRVNDRLNLINGRDS